MDNKYNKKLIVVCACILFILGGIVGWAIMQSYLDANLDAVKEHLRIVYLLVAALVPALILSLSVKPIVYLFGAIIESIKKLFVSHSTVAIAGAFLGVVLGLMIAFLVYAIMSQFVAIFALNLLVTIFVAIGACIVCAIACSKWLTSSNEVEEVIVEKYNGYILSYSAFYNEKLLKVLGGWINGTVVVLKCTIDRLISDLGTHDNAKYALSNYDELNKSGLLTVIDINAKDNDKENLIHYASIKHLKVIVGYETELKEFENEIKLLSLDML